MIKILSKFESPKIENSTNLDPSKTSWIRLWFSLDISELIDH